MFKYCLLVEKAWSTGEQDYIDTHGVLILDESGNEFYRLSDIWSCKEDVQKLIDKCNEHKVHPVYMQAIVECFYNNSESLLNSYIRQVTAIHEKNKKSKMNEKTETTVHS